MADIPSLASNPCGRASALSAIRDKVMSGQSVAEFEKEQGNGVRRRLKFSTANLATLEREIAYAERACAASSGKAGGRRMIGPHNGGWR